MQMSTSLSLKGPSIKYVRTLFVISWPPLPSVISTLFYTYQSSLFSQFFCPSPQKSADAFYGCPQTLKGWWGGRAAAWCCEIYMEFALVCARYVCMYCCLHNKDTKVYWVLWRWDIYSQIFKSFCLLVCFLHLVKLKYSESAAKICSIFRL